MSWVSVDDCVA